MWLLYIAAAGASTNEQNNPLAGVLLALLAGMDIDGTKLGWRLRLQTHTLV